MATDFWDVQEIVREAKAEERAAIVAHLRARANECEGPGKNSTEESDGWRDLALEIERGEHRKGGGERGP